MTVTEATQKLQSQGYTHLCDCTVPEDEGFRPVSSKDCPLDVEIESERGQEIIRRALSAGWEMDNTVVNNNTIAVLDNHAISDDEMGRFDDSMIFIFEAARVAKIKDQDCSIPAALIAFIASKRPYEEFKPFITWWFKDLKENDPDA